VKQIWHADGYGRNAAFVPALGRAALALHREQILDDVTRLLAPSLCDDSGRWTADVRLRLPLHL